MPPLPHCHAPLPFFACSLAVADLACSVGFLIYLNLNLFACLSRPPRCSLLFIDLSVLCVFVCVLCVFVCVVLNVVSAYFWGLLFSGFVFN